ncbi:DUF1127 domain-containing protein [Moritella sp. Urea-trap-13]|uniref:DUF1127 domain-containing protein n=1 Tax=Moritella sp. Urea-trap-13 TaxID=2058327 RepID=UPI000C345695|nr:DUF1127 domain-containing protein [Moritella sp. Urea-trap-13]PKH07570.1 DUF1127 domain-containing protein [Moritella sp. Urea-trap-13]
MRHSLYLNLAVFFVRADIRREERVWLAKTRRATSEIPLGNAYLLKDIGLNVDGRPLCSSAPRDVIAARRVRHLRRAFRVKIAT